MISHQCCLIPASLDLLEPQGLSGSLWSKSNFTADCFTQSLSSQALSTLVTQLCLQMNLFLAAAAAQHVVKSACLFKKPHVNLGTQQHTLHFKKPLWVDFYFHSFKMGIKKPWNSQYWTEREGWGSVVGTLWAPFSLWFYTTSGLAQTLWCYHFASQFPNSFSSGSYNHSFKAFKQRYSDTLKRQKYLKHSPLYSKPQVFAAHPVGLLEFSPVATSLHYISVPVAIKTRQ